MKHLIIILALLLSGYAKAQRTISSTFETPGNNAGCPSGYCPSLHINLEIFNFHKPRTSCLAGFGVCCRLSSSVTCEPCFHKSEVSERYATCYAFVRDESVELHIPAAIREMEGFEKSDFKSFEVESGTWEISEDGKETKFIKGGEYEVNEKDDELIVVLPFE